MKYMILIHSNSKSRQMWQSFSDTERAEGWEGHMTLHRDLVASGELIAAEALDEPSTGKRLEPRKGMSLLTDGPFAESKEFLAGFYLVNCASMERAMSWAARVPEAELGLVEVRPIMTQP